jgi:uncharacterized protein (TIGR03437 family)
VPSLSRRVGVAALVAVSFCILSTRVGSQGSAIRRVTDTAPETLNLNPTLSGDGRRLAFESSASIAAAGAAGGFHLVAADTSAQASFRELALSRAPAPALSQDGTLAAFASRDNIVGENTDGDSEIFFHDGTRLRQLTHTLPDDPTRRTSQGCFRPSISDDGRLVAFTSDRDINGDNADRNSEVFLLDTQTNVVTQITNTADAPGARDAKLSGDGSRVAFVGDRAAEDGGIVSDLLIYSNATGETFKAADGVQALAFTYGRAVSDDGLRVVYSARGATGATQVFMLDGRNDFRVRQLTQLGTRQADVPLHPTVSGDGNRVAFATRRGVTGNNPDSGVELYVYDIPSGGTTRLTDAPGSATAEVVSSLDDEGAHVVFNFPRVLSERGVSEQLANNSEIYLAEIPPRAPFATGLQLFNAALPNRTPPSGALAPDSMAILTGKNLSLSSANATRLGDGAFPVRFQNVTVNVGGCEAQIFYVSPTQINFALPAGLESGPAEVSVRNHDGMEFRGEVNIARAAPGVFTASGTGSGEALALDNLTLAPGPFEVTYGAGDARRLIIFCTGLRGASKVEATLGGRAVKVEAVVPSPDLPGLDQLHVALPFALRGAGTSTLVVRADGAESNRATLTLTSGGPPPRAARVELSPPASLIPVGGEMRFRIKAFDSLGDEITDPAASFTSDTSNVLTVNASGVATGVAPGETFVRVTVGGASAESALRVVPRTLVVNEVLADPPDGAAGDANHDGTRSGSEDEFVELVNAYSDALDLSGWTLRTRATGGTSESVRHTFPQGFALPSGEALALFGGGKPKPDDPIFGGALVALASSGSLSLTNAGLTILVRDASGNLVTQFAYGTVDDDFGGDSVNQSVTRAPDIYGAFARHTSANAARRFSPGVKADGGFFLERAGRLKRVSLTPEGQTVFVGESAQFAAQAFDQYERPMRAPAFGFEVSNAGIAELETTSVDAATGAVNASLRGLSPGETEIIASATDGAVSVRSPAAALLVQKRPPKIARVEVAPASVTLNRGGSARLTANAFDENNQPVEGAAFVWKSADDSVAAVDSSGMLKAVGIGVVQVLAVTPDNRGSEVSGAAEVSVRLPLVVNELLADVPPDDSATSEVEGDANRDGVRNSDDDEFIELLNYSAEPVELSGVQISDATSVRFTFPANTTLEAGRAVLVFGGGSPPADAFAGALVLKAGSLSLNDTGDTLTVKLPLAARAVVIDTASYGTGTSIAAPRDQSLTRSPDAGAGVVGGGFVAHKSAAGSNGRAYTPGTRADGTSFNSPPAPPPTPTPTPTPSPTPTPTATPTPKPTPTPTPAATPTPTATPKPSSTPTPSPSPTPTSTPTPSPTSTPTPSPTPVPTSTPTPTPSPSPTPQASVVISKVYGGGGNSGAPYKNDFIELFNRGDTAVNLAGWSVQYASATGTGNFSSNVTALLGLIAPGGYYLVQEAGGAAGSALPAPDVTGGNINMATTGGKVVLVSTPAGLACNGGSTPCTTNDLAKIVDRVGYGNANFYEGANPAPAASNTTAVLRKGEGCVDGDDNKADFATGTPNPRNGAAPPHACAVTQTKAGESFPVVGTTLPSFYFLLFGLASGESFACAAGHLCPVALSEPRRSGGSTRWRRGAWACGRRGMPAARPPPRGAWP